MVGVGLNSKGEGLRLTNPILPIWGMHGVTKSTSRNWLFSVLMLSSCIWGVSDSISGDVIGSLVYGWSWIHCIPELLHQGVLSLSAVPSLDCP